MPSVRFGMSQCVGQAWLSLGVTLALCLLVLNRKLKAYEIVR